MKLRTCLVPALSLAVAGAVWADSDASARLPRSGDFTTLATTPLVIEGLTGDADGNLYTTGRNAGNGQPCPVWRISLAGVTPVPVGFVPAPSATAQCSPSGLAFGPSGELFISEADKIYRVRPDAASPALASVHASGVPGTNGLAFDAAGNLWTGDGTTGQGRLWKITPAGAVSLVARIQPMANEVNLDAAGVGGIGRDVRSLPPGAITVTPTGRNAQNTAGSQSLVANGLAFDRRGDLLVADTARGAIWKLEIDRQGRIGSPMGCDTTFTPDTLCLSNVLVAHPLLEGADGIALDRAGNIWAAANERNAIVVVTREGNGVVEVFRNPANAARLRNAGPLEFPTSPVLLGDLMCTANSDGNRRDNAPSTAGEIGGAGQPRGKVSCLDQRLPVPGLPLPVRHGR